MAGYKKVAEVVVDSLRELGVRHVFGVPSGGWVDYMEALRKADGIEFVLTTHEGAAGMMADVCGRLTGVPGVCFGTFGPGATNLSTGVGEALLDRSPMIAFTDEMPEAMRGRTTQMGIDHQALFEPLTKKTTRLRAEAVKSTLFEAACVALEGRAGPVHVGLPVGLSAAYAPVENVAFKPPTLPAPALDEALNQAAQLLAGAKKPLIVLGLGAVRAGILNEVRQFIDKQQFPVVLTPMAKGMLPEDHSCYAGILFHALSDQVAATHQQADVVIAIGYDPVEFNYESWLPRAARLLSFDIVPTDIAQNDFDLAVDAVGDLHASVRFLIGLPAQRTGWDLGALEKRRDAMFAQLTAPGSHFGPKAALSVLRDILPDSGIMTCDVGAHTHLIGQVWRTPAPGLQIMTNGWSTMGFGIPAAIAAKLVHPDREVCAVVGDGGFLMTVGEIATAIREKLHIVIVLLTDNDLALIRIKQQKKGNAIYGTPVRQSGVIGGSTLLGAPVRTAYDPAEFREELLAAFADEGPCIVEAVVNSRDYDEVVLKSDRPS